MKEEVRKKLIALQSKDLEIRKRLVESGELFDGYNPKMEEVHRENAKQLRGIIRQFGWPGKSLAGEDGAYAAWFVLQHDIGEPDFIRSCIPLLQDAAEKGELLKEYVAMTIDRVRIYEGKEQVYGTHYDWDDNGEISPIFLEYPQAVDERRASMDLPSIAENTKRIREETERENNRPPRTSKFIARKLKIGIDHLAGDNLISETPNHIIVRASSRPTRHGRLKIWKNIWMFLMMRGRRPENQGLTMTFTKRVSCIERFTCGF